MKLPIEYIKTRKEYILFKNDCGVTDMARRGDIYEHYIFDYIKENIDVKGKTIVDVGANFGFHSMEFADLVGESGKVISFEPQKLVYYQLCGNIILNGYDNITAHNIALSNESTTLKMENLNYHSESTINIGNAHLNAYTNLAYNEVEVKPLDLYEFDNLAVLKIDVQGYEPNVLDGAILTILKHKPIIFIEVELPQLQVYGWKEEDVFQRLEKLGYDFKKVIEADHLVDYIAIPKENDDLLSQLIKEKPDSIHNVIPSDFFTKYDNWDYVWCKNYYEWNYAIARVLKPKTFLEIGVRFGFSFLPTMIGSENMEYALGWDLETYGNNQIATDNIRTYYKGICNWEIQHIDSQQINEIPQFFDLINIDGCHDYDCKVHDLKLAMKKCKWVTVDDYDYHSEVRRAVDDFIKEFEYNIEEHIYIPTFRGTKLITFKTNG